VSNVYRLHTSLPYNPLSEVRRNLSRNTGRVKERRRVIRQDANLTPNQRFLLVAQLFFQLKPHLNVLMPQKNEVDQEPSQIAALKTLKKKRIPDQEKRVGRAMAPLEKCLLPQRHPRIGLVRLWSFSNPARSRSGEIFPAGSNT
jgi:hypothetical protein